MTSKCFHDCVCFPFERHAVIENIMKFLQVSNLIGENQVYSHVSLLNKPCQNIKNFLLNLEKWSHFPTCTLQKLCPCIKIMFTYKLCCIYLCLHLSVNMCMTGHQTFEVYQTITQTFHSKSSAHKLAENLNIEHFFREIDPNLCLYMYTFFAKSGFLV